ncbi:MAG: YopX family protein [Paraclostridium sp.]
MREIKFRAWDKERKIMAQVNYLGLNDYEVGIKAKSENWNAPYPYVCKLMQCTGLKDKNGKEIYEGDIIKVLRKHWNNCEKEYLEKITEEIGEVVFYKNLEVSLKTKVEEGYLYQPFLWIFEDEEDHQIEIIGNIYENKDLLK